MASTINASTSSGLVSTADTSGVLQIQTAGTTAVTVDASQNVGIGTSSPSNKLVVSSAGANGLEINPTSGVSSGASLNGYNRSTSAYTPLTYSALSHYFQVGSSPGTAATLDSSGLLTVGNTSPAGSSQITAYGASNGQIAVQNSTNWSRLLQNSGDLYIDNGVGGSAGNIIFRNSSSTVEQMRLNSTGLLVGTTSNPQNSKLMVGGTVQVKPAANNSLEIFGPNSGTGIRLFARNDAGTLNRLELQGGQVIFPLTSGADGLYFDATSGNLGIGTSSPSASAILDAQSTTKGVRMPNMTTTQKNAIVSPAAGLMVFDTTLAKLCVYSGSAWQTITSV
jgi:hypothetical protein